MVGISGKELSQKLQLIPRVTLEMTVQEVPQSVEVKVQVNQHNPVPFKKLHRNTVVGAD